MRPLDIGVPTSLRLLQLWNPRNNSQCFSGGASTQTANSSAVIDFCASACGCAGCTGANEGKKVKMTITHYERPVARDNV